MSQTDKGTRDVTLPTHTQTCVGVIEAGDNTLSVGQSELYPRRGFCFVHLECPRGGSGRYGLRGRL